MRAKSVHMTPLRTALGKCRPYFILAAIFSALGNLLYLTPTLFMMQVYDRVVPTGGLATLVALGLIASFALGALVLFEWLRGRVLLRAGARLEEELSSHALRMALSRSDLSPIDSGELMRDFDTFRHGISSAAVLAALDAPWTIVYIGAAFLLHPWIGVLTVAASLLLLGLAWLSERSSAPALRSYNEASRISYARLSHATGHAAEVRALGMNDALVHAHREERALVNHHHLRAGFVGTAYGSGMKFFRLFLQSAALALAAVLVVRHELSGGAMIAATLLLSRAIAPIEQIVGGWKSIVHTRTAYDRLTKAFGTWSDVPRTLLPDPTGALSVERITVLSPGTNRVALADISFEAKPGDVVALIGASGSGKSTLLRAIAGGLDPVRGTIRLDGASRSDWNEAQLTRAIGYLPQNFMLFPGSIRDNIARFQYMAEADAAALDAKVVAAAQSVGAHDMILRLPNAYDSMIQIGEMGLSSGQTQRIALARALFGDPKLILLDEPSASLDSEAKLALTKLLVELRSRGTTVVFSSHDSDLVASADRILKLEHGILEALASPLDRLQQRQRAMSRTPISFGTQGING